MVDLLVLLGFVAAAFFCAGAAFGSWRKHRVAHRQYEIGYTAGQNEARALYSRVMPDEPPRLQPRRAPFAGRAVSR